MGTNYYAKINFCKECGRFDELHIGKSSAGWKFAIEIHEEFYKDLKQLFNFLTNLDGELYNEYGEAVTPQSLFQLIEEKKNDKSHFDGYPKDKYKDCEDADLNRGQFS